MTGVPGIYCSVKELRLVDNWFKGKRVLITGGASGFGKQLALILGREGSKVIIWDIDPSGEKVAQEIRAGGGDASFDKVDVRFSTEVQEAAEKVGREYSAVDFLVNSAGVHQIGTGNVVETTEEEYDRVMDTNVKGIFLCSKHIIPYMRKLPSSVIVNIASAWGTIASNKVPVYCTSKAAVMHLTRAMALDHASEGIRVNAVCPGTCRTPMVEKMVAENYEKLGFESEDAMWDSRQAAHPLGVGTAENVSDLIVFLLSERASWITGESIIIDGGYTLGKTFVGKSQ